MDKHAINKFAVQARRDLIAAVTNRLNALGITETGASQADTRSTREAEFYRDGGEPLVGKDIGRRQEMVKRLKEMAAKSDWATAFHDLIEEVAYTWFNRIIAIRFMEVNDYLPTNTRVLSSSENYSEPDIMRDALDLEEELGGYDPEERALIAKAQDRKQPVDMDAMYRMLFLKQVNKLNESLPKLFEKTDDFMTLLFTPSYNRGVIADLVEQIPEGDFDIASDDSQGQVEIIGWLYQDYNQEPKDVAFKKRNYTQADIPAVTQLFTPDWIVKYLVENSVGRTWIDHLQAAGDTRSQRDLAQSFGWQYFMPDAPQSEAVITKMSAGTSATLTPEALTVFDPAMGSGHILIYAFELLMQIYSSQGYSQREAARLILQRNLYGADIDTRAFQLSYFAMMMKGRQYDRRLLRSDLTPRVIDVPEIVWNQETIDLMTSDGKLRDQLKIINSLFSHGNELGSLIRTDAKDVSIDALRRLTEADQGTLTLDSERRELLYAELLRALDALTLLNGTYATCVTNPPYMGAAKMPDALAKFVKQHYPKSKADLFAVFMERLRDLTIDAGYDAMITQHQWMFLSSFEALRGSLSRQTFINLAHLGTRAFEEIGGEVVQSVAFVMRKMPPDGFVGTYERLVDFDSQDKKEVAYLEAVKNPEAAYVYRANQANFGKIPGSPIAYWASANLLHDFEVGTPMAALVEPRQGMATTDNKRFIRQWYEVAYARINFNATSTEDAQQSGSKWFPYNKGGSYRKWYGNYDYVVNYENDGQAIKANVLRKYPYLKTPEFVVKNPRFYFREAITWSLINSGGFSIRFRVAGSIHDVSGMSAYAERTTTLTRIMGLLATPIADHIFKMLNPTINLQVGDFTNFPVLDQVVTDNRADATIADNIRLAKLDWDLAETSWDFAGSVLLAHSAEHRHNWTLAAAFAQWAKAADDRFNRLKANEEALNRIFIELYGLQDELTPAVADKDVSVRRADRPRDIKAFLSYFIGVVFGRYSLDVPGLAFAGGDWDAAKYQTFQPNVDNMIVLTDRDDFGDSRDIINRLREFLTVTFGAEHLAENLRFIADSLGKKGDTPEDQIRKYFRDDFYKKDHLAAYQKRPIYWQLDSGKQGGFRALMYLHRYDADTLAMARTSYLHPLQEADTNRLVQLEKMVAMESSTRQRNLMIKQITQLKKQLDEIVEYDTKLQHVANMHIAIDLDDGVLVNHEVVQGGQRLLSPLK